MDDAQAVVGPASPEGSTGLPALQILTLFPSAVAGILDSSILRRAQAQGLVELSTSDLRAFAVGRHRAVDGCVFGGEQGMLMKPDVLERACAAELAKVDGHRDRLKVIYLSPRGYRMDQAFFSSFSSWLLRGEVKPAALAPGVPVVRRIVFVCGRYEGVDERWVRQWVDLELSLGDFILTGGELAALAAVDGIVRLLPGVLGDGRSAPEDSFSTGLLEQPQFTRPREFNGQGVPEPLLSGNHKVMGEWKLRQSLLLTYAFRPDLIRAFDGSALPHWAQALLTDLRSRLAPA